ncbi:metallophosphoesterase [Spirochaetia bacterium 38H-sp]|uniref:Metallophosphoesterase n=1 Tax=Rarispira pelagica TaxID=3141764 RepID=A0ABU9U8D5_9SPIR
MSVKDRIIVLGDIHAMYEEACFLLEHALLIDSNKHWIANNTSLIFLGDVCDRGYDSASMYRLIIELQKQAVLFNSEVLFILGNHEIMESIGYNPYMSEEEESGYQSAYLAFSPGGWLRNWLEMQNAVIKRGDFIFAHGDLPENLADRDMEELNREIMSDYMELDFQSQEKTSDHPLLFNSKQSIMWSRDAQSFMSPVYKDTLARFLARNNAKHYVCGHTPQEHGRFFVGHDNMYICIDTGMIFTRYYDSGSLSYLEIKDNKASAVYFDNGEDVPHYVELLEL